MRVLASAASLLVVAGLSSALVAGCGSPEVRPRIEDRARRVAPIPACVFQLPPRKAGAAFVRNLKEEEQWRLVFPEFDINKKQLPKGALACTGDNPLADSIFEGGEPLRGWPLTTQEGDIVIGSGGDRLKIIWLRSHKFGNGIVAGTLALIRTQESYAEVYAVGVYKGRGEKSRFALERIGGELVVTAQDDGCTGRGQNDECETLLRIFLPRKGRLANVADISLERVAFAMNSEPGALGRIEYHLTSSPRFQAGGILVMEQVRVLDDRNRALRKAELERIYTLAEDRKMQTSDDPLWPRVYPLAVLVKGTGDKTPEK